MMKKGKHELMVFKDKESFFHMAEALRKEKVSFIGYEGEEQFNILVKKSDTNKCREIICEVFDRR